MNMKKIATMATCMALVGAVAVGGTLALLTKEDSITNTFVVGNGFPVDPEDPDDENLPFFYVNETVVKMEESTGNWVADGLADPGRTIMDQTYGPRGGKPETDNWKVTAGVELLKDPQFYVNHDKVEKEKEVPEVFVVAKIGAIPTGFEVYTGNDGANWYQVTTSDNGKTWTKVGEQLKPDTKLDENTYYIYSEPLDANSSSKDDWNTTKLFELVKTNDQVSNDNDNENKIKVSGVAVETPVKGATLDENNLNTIVSAAYKVMK